MYFFKKRILNSQGSSSSKENTQNGNNMSQIENTIAEELSFIFN